jgi:hypothetical protein
LHDAGGSDICGSDRDRKEDERRMKDPAKRYEINRQVKNILTRFAVDLTQLQYSTSGETVYLFGKLEKEPKGDFKPPEIETIVKEIAALEGVRDIQFDISNWSLVYEPGFTQISQKR